MSFFRATSQTLRSSGATGALRQCALQKPAQFHSSAARLALSNDARKKIQTAVHSNPLVVFMKGTPEMPMCGFSRTVIQILDVQGVDRKNVKTYNCLDDQELREGIKEFSSWPTIPQVYVQGEFTGGCDIMLSMHQSGELEKLLQDAKVLISDPATNAA